MRFFSTAFIVGLWSIFLPINVEAQNAGSLFTSGQDLYKNAQYEQAANNFRESGQLFLQQKDSVNWVRSRYWYGDAMMSAGNIQEGLNALLSIDEHKPQQIPNDLKALIKNSIGWAYRQLEQYDNSKEYYLKAIELADMSDDSVLIGRLNNNISYPYLHSGDYERAFSYQKRAKEIYESTGEEYRLSFVLNGMFATLRELGLHTQANNYIRQSLAIREEIGNPNLLDIAYHNMAVSYNALGKPDSAIIYYHKSLELSRELGNPYDITQTLINIGGLYEYSGDYDNALAYYNEALETNYQTERPVSISKNLMRLAEVAIQNNDLENAENFYQEALTWLEKASAPQELADLYLNIAELKLEQENYAEAKNYVADAKNISRENYTSQLTQAHNVLGEIYREEGKLGESLVQYRKAYDLYSNRGISSRITPAMNLARAYSEVHSDSAFTFAEEAFTLIDSIRTNVAGLTFRSGFFREHAGFYNEVAEWYITQKNDPQKAFELVEAAKARVLMDELSEAQEDIYTALDKSTLIRKQQKAKQIDRLYGQLREAGSDEEYQTLHRELKDLEFEYQSFLNEIHAGNKQLKNFSYPQPIALSQIQQLLDSDTAILEFAFTEKGMIQLVITQKNIHGSYIHSVEHTDAKPFISEEVRSFRRSIIEGGEIAEIQEKGAALYETLIPSALSSKDNSFSNLVIIPDGPLSFLPFEALFDGSNYLVEDHLIKYLPSASIYPFIQSPHRITTKGLLALAGSGFDSEQNVTSPNRSQASFASLPSTLLEVDSIAVNFESSTLLKNEEVTEASLKSHDLSNFQFLHFATHANVDEINPSRSGLLLSKKADVESLFGEDGHLNSREISNLQLNADLVTLSACNTGMGPIVTGEGLIGLQRSFISAGASSVMVSLWSVFDRSTSKFMSTFYRSLLTHREEEYGLWNQTMDWFGFYEHPMIDYKTKAIRDAKLSLINHPYYNHPVHWAPFILIGK